MPHESPRLVKESRLCNLSPTGSYHEPVLLTHQRHLWCSKISPERSVKQSQAFPMFPMYDFTIYRLLKPSTPSLVLVNKLEGSLDLRFWGVMNSSPSSSSNIHTRTISTSLRALISYRLFNISASSLVHLDKLEWSLGLKFGPRILVLPVHPIYTHTYYIHVTAGIREHAGRVSGP